MSRRYTFARNGTFKKRPKAICEFASMDKDWSPLDGAYIRGCRCVQAPSFPGCIEDFRVKKVVCNQYQPPQIPAALKPSDQTV